MSGRQQKGDFNTTAPFHSEQWWKDRHEYVERISELQSTDPDEYWRVLSKVDGVNYSEKRARHLASAEPMVKHFSFSDAYTPARIEDPSKTPVLKDVQVATYDPTDTFIPNKSDECPPLSRVHYDIAFRDAEPRVWAHRKGPK